ncbi:MAG: DUF5615 family PIN-like protein [Armatimonadetes bacterium]|nr:DUF5615 family PIN-like protein [Armatimonadota bacterium]
MPGFLTDAHLSPKVAEQARLKRPDIPVESLRAWRHGVLLEAGDAAILAAARQDGLVLVTYDQRTLIPLVVEWMSEGRDHAGLIVIDERSIAQEDIGTQVYALIALWEAHPGAGWTNRVIYLKPCAP